MMNLIPATRPGSDRARRPHGARLSLLAAWASLAIALAVGAPARGQDNPPTPPKPEGGEGPHGAGRGGPSDSAKQIEQVIHEIEQHMTEAERLLTGYDTSGDAQAHQEAAAELLKKLLDQAGQSQNQALAGIDKLLELAAQQAKQQSSGGGGGSRPRSEQERKAEEERKKREREQNELQRKQGKHDKPEDGQQDKTGEKNKDKSGKKPPDAGQEKNQNPDISGRWGLLPPDIRDRIIQGNWSGFPSEYMDKLQKFYRRVQSEEK